MSEDTKIPVLTMTAGLDIGNGDSKCKIEFNDSDPFAVSIPSTVAYTTGANTPKVPTKQYLDKLPNHLDAQVTGPGVKSIDEGRMFFGKRAIESGESLTMFNITNHVPKSQDSLSTILIDGITASSGVKYYFETENKLPDALNINAAIGIALPIEDYLDYRQTYKANLMSDMHTVIIRNFDKPIQVNISYKAVVIMAEGAAAQFAIQSLGPKFIQMALDEARKEGSQIDPGYTGELLAKATNSIGIDIGDGTVNFPVITNNQINIEASGSINKGYGTVLDGAVLDLANTTANFTTRRDLIDFLRDPANQLMPAQKATYLTASRAVENHKHVFARDIRTRFTSIFQKVGQRSQVIWIYGGGATPMFDYLAPILQVETKVGDDQNIPILWMNSKYSRNLNRNGLFEAARYGKVEANLQ